MLYNKPKRLGLYFHIPFCLSKCAYCDFFSFVPTNEELITRYINALITHMEEYENAAEDYTVDSVFIGGGTPTCVPTEELVRLIRAMKKNFNISKNAEFTIESNPATVDMQSLKKLRRCGVNRISIGLQTGDNNELRALSRIHTRAQFEQSYRIAREAGFTNINVDLMFGIPDQTKESLMRNLRYLIRLNPEHISLYNLKIEPGTPFDLHRAELALPNEDEEADMYLAAVEYLNVQGYPQYEISNFAKNGCRCRHNLKYWHCEEYLGFGPSAHSYFSNCRFSFVRDLDAYLNAIELPSSRIKLTAQCDEISPRERIGEYIMLHLRLNSGVRLSEFSREFGQDFELMYGRKMQRYIDAGFAVRRGDSIALTPSGMFVSNYILSDILDFADLGGEIFKG